MVGSGIVVICEYCIAYIFFISFSFVCKNRQTFLCIVEQQARQIPLLPLPLTVHVCQTLDGPQLGHESLCPGAAKKLYHWWLATQSLRKRRLFQRLTQRSRRKGLEVALVRLLIPNLHQPLLSRQLLVCKQSFIMYLLSQFLKVNITNSVQQHQQKKLTVCMNM